MAAVNEAGLRVFLGGCSLEKLGEVVQDRDLECQYTYVEFTEAGSARYSIAAGHWYASSTVDTLHARAYGSRFVEVSGRLKDLPAAMQLSPKLEAYARDFFAAKAEAQRARDARPEEEEDGEEVSVPETFERKRYVDVLPIAVIDRLAKGGVFNPNFVVRRDKSIAFSDVVEEGDFRIDEAVRDIAHQRLRDEVVPSRALQDRDVRAIVEANNRRVDGSSKQFIIPSERRGTTFVVGAERPARPAAPPARDWFAEREGTRRAVRELGGSMTMATPAVRRAEERLAAGTRPPRRITREPTFFESLGSILSNILGAVIVLVIAVVGVIFEDMFDSEA